MIKSLCLGSFSHAKYKENTTLDETLILLSADGVLEWDALISEGVQAVQDGSFEQGDTSNPYWDAGGSINSICSPATCGPDLATDGSWYLWFGGIGWLDISPSSRTLSPGQTDLMVTYDATGLTPGLYSDSLCVNSNDPDEPLLRIPVSLTVEPSPILHIDSFEE